MLTGRAQATLFEYGIKTNKEGGEEWRQNEREKGGKEIYEI